MRLSNHQVLITGGSGGIGQALAREFLSRGNRVAICGRNLKKLEKARNALGDIEIFQCDLEDSSAVAELPERVAERFGGLSILVNNAGVQQNYSFAEVDAPKVLVDAALEIQINLTSLISLTSACLPRLRAAEAAAVVNLSSGLAITPKASAPVYCATKAAVHSFSQAFRYQMQDSLPHVRVFEVMPPLVDTAMAQGRDAKKISPEQLVVETFQGLARDKYEIRIGPVKLLSILHRLVPSAAARILRNS